MATKLASRGHAVIKILDNLASKTNGPLTAADFTTKGKNLYADSTIPSFFRRPDFSPDGSLFITPCGIHKTAMDSSPLVPSSVSVLDPTATAATATTPIPSAVKEIQTFCTHIYSRDHYATPLISLVGLEDPSVAVRFSPVLYKLVTNTSTSTSTSTSTGADGGVNTAENNLRSRPNTNNSNKTNKCSNTMNTSSTSTASKKVLLESLETTSMIPGDYRMLFAVLTVSSVLVYDTQHPHPIARLGGLHLACINDASWTADGNTLIVCSSDGYISFIQFEAGSLGTCD